MKRHGEMQKMVPLAHVKAGLRGSGWMPYYSAKKERQLERRARHAAQYEAVLKRIKRFFTRSKR